MLRGVVDVEQHDVVRRSGRGALGDLREEVAVLQVAARVGGEAGGVGKEVASVPVDDSRDRLDDLHLRDPLVLERRSQRVAEPEASDEHLQALSLGPRGQAEVRELGLDDGEEARHQELVVDLDLVDVVAHRGLEAASQADHPDRGVLPAELLHVQGHAAPPGWK